jgi:transposase
LRCSFPLGFGWMAWSRTTPSGWSTCSAASPSWPHLPIAIERLSSLVVDTFVADPPDSRLVMSFPRAGRLCAAQIPAELGDMREHFLTADQLAAKAGVCPVTVASGKSRGVVFRWACNHRLRQAFTGFADNSHHACA